MADTITEILRRPGHRLLRLGDGSSVKVPTALFKQRPLQANAVFDADDYYRQLEALAPKAALEQAVTMLEQRDRSRQEILDKLTQAGYSQQAASYACDKLSQAGYLDDRRYAQDTLARLGKRYGVIRLKNELRRKGIDEELIEELLSEQEHGDQLAAAIAQAQKALRSAARNPDTCYQKAYAALARRGFPPQVVREALQAVFSESDHETEFIDG